MTQNYLDEIQQKSKFGLIILTVFFLGLAIWSFCIPLKTSVMVQGKLSPEGFKRTVQHLEGGKLKKIVVTEGQAVSKNQILAILHDTQIRAKYQTLQSRLENLQIQKARLQSEKTQQYTLSIPHQLQERRHLSENLDQLFKQETELLKTRLDAFQSQSDIFKAHINQIEGNLQTSQNLIAAIKTQKDLVQEEISSIETLVKKGLERKPRLLALQRTNASLDEKLVEQYGLITQYQQQIGEAKLSILNFENKRLETISQDLNILEQNILETTKEYVATKDILERHIIRAPINGIVQNIRPSRDGAVIRSGEDILDIFPEQEKLIIEATIPALQIEQIYIGMPAFISLKGVSMRAQKPVMGEIKQIDADVRNDQTNATSYYRFKIELQSDALQAEHFNIKKIYSGMPTIISLEGDERYLSDYLTEPLTLSFKDAFQVN